MISKLKINDMSIIPEVTKYKDKHSNTKQTLFLVWDSDGEPRPASYIDGKFCHTTNKAKIKEPEFWAEIPRNLKGGL